MAMPKTLKNFNVFVDGVTYIGVAEKVKLPDLKRKTEDLRAAGMNGAVKSDMGQEGMTCEHEYAGFVSELFKTWGIAKVSGTMLRFAGALQQEDSATVTSVEVVMRGRHSEVAMPEAEGGKKGSFKVKTDVAYFKYTENGTTIVEIDLLNMIEIVGGVDRMAEQRRAIGMA